MLAPAGTGKACLALRNRRARGKTCLRATRPMNPPTGSVPRIPKAVFLWVDVFLLLVAIGIAAVGDSDKPFVFGAIVGCLVLAALVVLVPFLLDYAADSADAAREDEAKVAAQIARLESAAEALTRAAAQVQAVESAVHKAAKDAENLPYRMQEKLAEFNEALAEKEDEQRGALEQELAELRAAHSEQLKAAAARIKETVAELSALQKNAQAQLAAADAAAARLAAAGTEAAARFEGSVQSALARLDDRLAELAKSAAAIDRPARRARASEAEPVAPAAVASVIVTESAPTPEPAAPEPVPAAPEPATAAATEPPAADRPAADAVVAAEAAKPRKPRAPRKPKPEEIMAALSGEAAVAVESAPPIEAPAPDLSAQATPKAETSMSADGATRLLATAYIGIGNKLFIRGDGPGLSWDVGVPMQFVSIGKWGWSTQEASGPITIRLYKNDETPALSGEVQLEPGQHTEVTALF